MFLFCQRVSSKVSSFYQASSLLQWAVMGHVVVLKAFVSRLENSPTAPLDTHCFFVFIVSSFTRDGLSLKSLAVLSNDTLAGLHLLPIYTIFHVVYYLMLGSIPFHVFLWFLFNERHWFAPISSSLVTMKMSWCVFAMVSRPESRPSCSFWSSEQMYKKILW